MQNYYFLLNMQSGEVNSIFGICCSNAIGVAL